MPPLKADVDVGSTRPPTINWPGPPRNAVEEVLAAIWAEALGRDRVDAHGNVFELGAHSLLITQVASRVRETLAVDLPLRDFFEAPTVAGLAEREPLLADDPGNYDANRQLGTLLLSQHRFREAVVVAAKNRDARPYDAMNYGIIGDGYLELGEYEEAFEAFGATLLPILSAAGVDPGQPMIAEVHNVILGG